MIVNQILQLGDEGQYVEELQRQLRAMNLYLGPIDGKYGILTQRAVEVIQRVAGYVVDGIAGPVTLNKLFKSQATEEMEARLTDDVLVERIVKVAQRYIGTKEVRENSSPTIDKWLRECGLDPGYAWCMAAVQGWILEACQELHVPDVLTPNSAGVLDVFYKAKCQKIGPKDGKRGDILIMDYGQGKGHTGIVVGYKDGYYYTIEGNSNEAGSREANAVVPQKRKYNDPRIKGFLRISSKQ